MWLMLLASCQFVGGSATAGGGSIRNDVIPPDLRHFADGTLPCRGPTSRPRDKWRDLLMDRVIVVIMSSYHSISTADIEQSVRNQRKISVSKRRAGLSVQRSGLR